MAPGAYQFDLVCLPASSRGFPVPTLPVLGLQTHIVALFRGCWGFKCKYLRLRAKHFTS